MHNDRKLFLSLIFLLALPIGLAAFGGDRFRYPCQDPHNWDKDICKVPLCDVTRTCPEHVFKGQIDPRTLGKGKNETPNMGQGAPTFGQAPTNNTTQGCNCGK